MKTLSFIAGLLVLVAFVPYILAILQKTTKPAKASWVIWGVLDTVTFAGMYAKGTVNGQIIGAVIGVWIVVVLAIMHGTPGWTKLDKLCLVGAAFAIVLWVVFKEANFGIGVAQVALFIGALPTFQSAWEDPARENKLAWTLFWLSCFCAVIAIPRWTFADAAQPITFFVIESIVVTILLVRPSMLTKRTVSVRLE